MCWLLKLKGILGLRSLPAVNSAHASQAGDRVLTSHSRRTKAVSTQYSVQTSHEALLLCLSTLILRILRASFLPCLELVLLQVRYTCKLCGTTTTKAVNPHAWATGTVFGRCDGCQVIHKLTDNLELFHELSGSVINSPIDPDSISIPDGLPQNPYIP